MKKIKEYSTCQVCGKHSPGIHNACTECVESWKEYKRCPACNKWFSGSVEQTYCGPDCFEVLKDEIFEKYDKTWRRLAKM